MELIKEKVWIKDGRPVREALNDHGRDLTLAYQILKSWDASFRNFVCQFLT